MAKHVKMGIEIEYLMMGENGAPILSGWRQNDISSFPGLQILAEAADSIQKGIKRRSDSLGHVNVYKFRDGKIMLPDTYTLLETVTSPSVKLDILRDQLWSMKHALITAAKKHNRSMVSGAACPVGYDYDSVGRGGRVTANNAGMHIHLEAPNDKVKIKLCNMIMQLMPELTALSVNSPVYNKTPSGLCSKRLSTSPLVGPSGVGPMEYEAENPLQFDNPGNRYRYITPYTNSQRTIELRGFDTPLNIDWAMAIAALLQCLGVKASRLFVDEQRNTVVGNNSGIRKANFDAAMSDGLQAEFSPDHSFAMKLGGKRHLMSFLYHNKAIPKNTIIPAAQAVKRLLYYIEAEAYELGLIPYLQPLYDAVRTGRDQARLQLDWYQRNQFKDYLKKLNRFSAKGPGNKSQAPGKKRNYFTVRQKSSNADPDKVYLSLSSLRLLKAQEGDVLTISGPLGSIRAESVRQTSDSKTINLAKKEIRLGEKLRSQLGISMYDPVIIGRGEMVPFTLNSAGREWIP